ncbi:hypothetical protein CK203_051374 [Vitis vinifera]|uniref:Uncharacterized protein n=1 Tax=Vitis vinifera TaxID=29760 RepID=A0A438FLY5_VITVI|nr:hypothetical protein CK203_051374 [Vitis vinifera]
MPPSDASPEGMRCPVTKASFKCTRNAKKCRKCPEHVREEMEECMSSKKSQNEQMNMESEDVNEDLFGLEDEDCGKEINSRMNVTNIFSGVTYPSFQSMIEVIDQYGVVLSPLVRVLRLVYGEKKTPTGYIYEAMNRIKDTILNGGLHMELQLQICKDNLTWGDVARAIGAEEARFDTRARARASLSIIPPMMGIVSSSKTLLSH